MKTAKDLRNFSTSAVLQALLWKGRLARYELADLTGLTRTTISNVVTDLLAMGLVREADAGPASSLGGRKPVFLTLEPDAVVVLGIDLRRERVSSCLVNVLGEIRARHSRPLEVGCPSDVLWSVIDDVIAEVLAQHSLPLHGIGLGSIAPLKRPLDFDAIQGIDLGLELERRYGVPAVVEPGATAAAIGEHFWPWKWGRPLRSLAFVNIDYRIGMGIVAGDHVWDTAGQSVSLGHTTITGDMADALCSCGRRGCLDLYASGKTLLDHVRWSELRVPGPPDLSVVARLGHEGHPGIRAETLARGAALAEALLNVDRLFHPECIVLGSSHQHLNALYLDAIRPHLIDHPAPYGDVPLIERIRLSTHGSYAIAFGASTLVLKAFFESPLGAPRDVPSGRLGILRAAARACRDPPRRPRPRAGSVPVKIQTPVTPVDT